MIQFIKLLMTSLVFTLGLVACANLTERQDQVDSVIASQLAVLKKMRYLREQEDVRFKVSTDPFLLEKERILIVGLNSVINSQEVYLKTKNKLERK